MDCYFSSSSSTSFINVNTNSKKKKRKKGNLGNSARRQSWLGSTVKLSTDPQSVAARERRHRISDRFKILQSMVPGGAKMDTVSMLDEAIHYVKFLKAQIWLHQNLIFCNENPPLVHDDATVSHQGQFGHFPFDHFAEYDPGLELYSHLVPLPDSCVGLQDNMHCYESCEF